MTSYRASPSFRTRSPGVNPYPRRQALLLFILFASLPNSSPFIFSTNAFLPSPPYSSSFTLSPQLSAPPCHISRRSPLPRMHDTRTVSSGSHRCELGPGERAALLRPSVHGADRGGLLRLVVLQRGLGALGQQTVEQRVSPRPCTACSERAKDDVATTQNKRRSSFSVS